MKSKRRRGFTIIESLIYIFITTLILSEGLNLSVLMYKSYLDNARITKEYNDVQNFYILFQEILSQTNISEIKCNNDKLEFYKYVDGQKKKKSLEYKPNENSVVVKNYDSHNSFENSNKILGDVKNITFINKGKLIYVIISSKDGKEFISCI